MCFKCGPAGAVEPGLPSDRVEVSLPPNKPGVHKGQCPWKAGPRRMLSLLVFALSADLLVPRAPIERLHAMVLDDAPDTESAT